MNLQPLDDRIVVKPGDAEETTASGLVIPDTAKEKPQQGEVLAIGPGKRSEDTGERYYGGKRSGHGDTLAVPVCWRSSYGTGADATAAQIARCGPPRKRVPRRLPAYRACWVLSKPWPVVGG